MPLGREIELYPVHVAGQSGGADQEDDENAVREQGREVNQL